MKRIFFTLLCFIAITTLTFAQDSKAENVVKLSYIPLETTNDGTTFTMTAKLKVENTGPSPIYNVRVRVDSTTNVTVDISEISLGNIASQEIATSHESFKISFGSPLSQEAPQAEIIWQVEYTDTNGNSIVEKTQLK
jgi:hypothetical protein